MREQDELQPDLDILNLYADEHLGMWGGVEFAASARPARLVAFITEERDRHAARLRSVVPHPDRLDVEQVAMSARDRAALAGQLVERLRATLPADSSFGVGHTNDVPTGDPGPGCTTAAPHLHHKRGRTRRTRAHQRVAAYRL